jgi:hypothetical protein
MLFGITFCAGTASLLTLFLQDDPVLRPAVPLLVLLVVIPIAISGHPCGYYRRNDCKSDVCRLAVSSLGQPCSTRSQRPDNSAFVSDRCDRHVASPFATIFHVTPLEQTRAIARIGSREPLLVESPSAPNYPRVEHVGNPWRNGHCGASPRLAVTTKLVSEQFWGRAVQRNVPGSKESGAFSFFEIQRCADACGCLLHAQSPKFDDQTSPRAHEWRVASHHIGQRRAWLGVSRRRTYSVTSYSSQALTADRVLVNTTINPT